MRTSSSAAFKAAFSASPLTERVELIKWLALVLMVVDHAGRYAGYASPAWVFLGRGAFPLFAISFGYALSVVPDARALMLRLLAFGFLSEVLGAWTVTRGAPVNVLFTFALCAYLLHRRRVVSSPAGMIIPGVLVYLVAELAEYGIAGVMLTCAAWWMFTKPSVVRAAVVLVVSVFLMVPNRGMWFGSLWAAVGLLMLLLPVGLPRIKRVFYVAYVGQWPLLAVLR